jgi:uncharacterized protein YecE (DUF72 family)
MTTLPKQNWTPPEPPPDITTTGCYVGTSGYYFDDWVGVFNPPKITGKRRAALTDEEQADQDRLRFYQKYFSFVEINNTFYRDPIPAYFHDIVSRSKENMKYAVKVHRDISHSKSWSMETGRELMRNHIAAVSPLAENDYFYSFLIQLEDRLYRSQKILDYLLSVGGEAVKKGLDVHIEFRHISWHDFHPLQSLKDAGIGICNTEIPPVHHAFPLKAYATTDKGYLRYSGRNLQNWYPKGPQKTAKERIAARNARYDYKYTDTELEQRVRGQLTLIQKTSSVAVAFNNHYQTKAVQNAITNIRMLKEKLLDKGT